jgi:hypothetical protein
MTQPEMHARINGQLSLLNQFGRSAQHCPNTHRVLLFLKYHPGTGLTAIPEHENEVFT